MSNPEEFTVTVERKNLALLFGSVIAANVATVFVLQTITTVAKRFVKPKVEEVVEDDEQTLKQKAADILERQAQHLRGEDD